MVVDGQKIAEELLNSVASKTKELSFVPKLGVVTCAPGIETRQYLELKKRKARQVGIDLIVLELLASSTTEDCIDCVNRLAQDCHGVLVQLPLPETIDRDLVLEAVPVTKDPDGFAFGRDSRSLLPPVASAIDIISKKYDISFTNKKVTVVGNGKLVGQPAARYAKDQGAEVVLLTEGSADYAEQIKTADILILGVGKSHFITKDMVKEGVVVFDAGASEDGGEVVGDMHPEVAEVASLYTPVPGGIGPITVAALLDNLLQTITRS